MCEKLPFLPNETKFCEQKPKNTLARTLLFHANERKNLNKTLILLYGLGREEQQVEQDFYSKFLQENFRQNHKLKTEKSKEQSS